MIDAISRGDLTLWQGQSAVAVSQVSGELCIVAAEGDMDDLAKIDASATAWAKALGLHRITIRRTRKGWARRLRGLGYHSEMVVTKEL